jgi:RNA polymerase sigma-70 factor (ECF subfamily)
MSSRAPDSGFVESLYRRNETDLKSFVKRRIDGDGAVDVDDIVQEAFLRIATHRGAEELKNPRGFLFRIARNLIFDTLRRGKVRKNYARAESADAVDRFSQGNSGSAEQAVSSREDLELIFRAIDTLPPRCRQVFLLQRDEELSYARIAERLGISESMVQKHMSKALSKLSEVLP